MIDILELIMFSETAGPISMTFSGNLQISRTSGPVTLSVVSQSLLDVAFPPS